jgi:hypothetical protein
VRSRPHPLSVAADIAATGVGFIEPVLQSVTPLQRFPILVAGTTDGVSMTTKAERQASLRAEIARVCQDVEEEFRPSPWQYDKLRDAVQWADGCDPDGYFIGTCILGRWRDSFRDRRRKPIGPHLARYNMLKGVMRCDPDGDRPSCHESAGRTISIGNAVTVDV